MEMDFNKMTIGELSDFGQKLIDAFKNQNPEQYEKHKDQFDQFKKEADEKVKEMNTELNSLQDKLKTL